MFTTGGIILGSYMAIICAFFVNAAFSEDTHIIKKIFTQIIICGIVFFLIALMQTGDEKNWNNGYCTECGTKYQAIGKSRTGSTTYYSCPECFHEAVR